MEDMQQLKQSDLSKFQYEESTSLRDENSFVGSKEGGLFVESTLDQKRDQDRRDIFKKLKQQESDQPSWWKVFAIILIGLFLVQMFLGHKSSSQSIQEPNQKKIEQITQKTVNEDPDDSFNLNFVETQFEGKQTEQSLAKAAFAEMESRFNLGHFTGDNQNDKEKKKLLEDISSLEIMIPDHALNDYVAQNFYFFSVSVHQMILNSDLDQLYRNGQTIYRISLKQHMRAIIRTQLVHNVNFKGEIQVELSPFDKGIQEKKEAIKEIMQDEEIYYESFYQLSKYNKHQIRFCILVPSYKNVRSRLYLRNLDSIFMQDYQNYHVVYIDDASPDKTGEYVRKYVEEREIPPEKIQVFINDVNKKAMYNIYHGIHSYCPDGEVVGLIDGDDSLLGRKVLQLYNAVYQEKRTALIYSNFLKILTNNKTSFGFGTELNKHEFKSGKLRNDMSLLGTHFMTFFSDLFKKIKKQDLTYQNGTFYDYAYDRAIITPMVEMAYPRVQYLAEITYEYRNDTGINDGTYDWERVSRIILGLKPYQQIDDFSFIDDFVDQTERIIEAEIKSKENKKILPHTFFQDLDQQKESLQKEEADSSKSLN